MIYLDAGATTPCDPRVVEAMLPHFYQQFGNASSPHFAGERADKAVEIAREHVADLINARASEIVWTSGATESNNLAIRGLAQSALRGPLAHAATGTRRAIAIGAIEHKSVTEVALALENDGFEIIVLPVDGQGTVRLDKARELIDENTLLVCVQAANGEIGTIQPIGELAEIAHQNGALFHCDAAQAAGKIPLDLNDLNDLNVDSMALSAHKMFGPQGVGALWLRRGLRGLLVPQQIGGGQERGLRAGTTNVPGIVGMGAACEICQREMNDESTRLSELRDELENRLQSSIANLQLNGDRNRRLPHCASLTFAGVDAGLLMARLPDVALSNGAACDAGAPGPSQTLLAIGLSREAATSTVRVGLHRFNTAEEIKRAAELIVIQVEELSLDA